MIVTRGYYIAQHLQRLQKLGNTDTSGYPSEQAERMQGWYDDSEDKLKQCLSIFEGSGFDCFRVDWDAQNSNSLDAEKFQMHLEGSYHVMDGNGYYVTWVDFGVRIFPTLLNIEGFDFELDPDWDDDLEERYCIKEYIEDTLWNFLTDRIPLYAERVDKHFSEEELKAHV